MKLTAALVKNVIAPEENMLAEQRQGSESIAAIDFVTTSAQRAGQPYKAADPSAPVLSAGSDSGLANNDNLTNVSNPTFVGTAEPGWTVILYDHKQELGRAVADAITGEYRITTTVTLEDGDHKGFKVEAYDGIDGKVLKSKAGPVITIDTVAPAAPGPADLLTDSGQSGADNVTNTAAPTFAGTAPPGEIVTLYAGDFAAGTAIAIGSATVSASGAWTITSSALPDGAHNVTATTTDLAGNLGKAVVLPIVIDTTRPTATIVVDDAALKLGDTSLVTVRFSEPVFGFSNADVTVANGVLGTLVSSDGGITWTAPLTAVADVTDTSNVITLANSGVADLAGNAGAGETSSNNYAVDTQRPTAGILVADSALRAGESSQVTITFSEAVQGFSNADLLVENGALSDVVSTDGGVTWTAVLTPAADLTDASNIVTLANPGLTDLAGNAGAGSTASNNYAIDTLRPASSVVVEDSALRAGETTLVTIAFSEAVTGFSNADLSVANGTLSDVVSADGGMTWTATLTPDKDLTDSSNAVTLANTGLTDLAGNAGVGITASNNYAIDTLRPTVTIAVADTALRIGETSTVAIRFSEAVHDFDNADLVVGNGSLTDVVSADGGISWTATLTPAAEMTDAANIITLSNAGVTDAAGNAGVGLTDSNSYAVDTVRPAATIVVADNALSAGETTQVSITFAEPVRDFTSADLVVENGALADLSSSDGGTTWTATLTPATDMTDTANVVTLANDRVTDLAGNAGVGISSSNSYAIDTLRPTAGIMVADTALRAGETSQVTITFSEAVRDLSNADLAVENGTLTDVASNDGGITWTATLTPSADLADTSNTITLANAALTDLAGNAGVGSTVSNNYAIDTLRPTASIMVDDTALRAGESSKVTITFSEAVRDFGNGDLVVDNGALTDVVSTDGGITWTAMLTPATDLTDTSNVVTLANAGLTDLAGNAGLGATVSNNYAIDTLRPSSSITVADNALRAGQASQVTITFFEAVREFSNADLSVENGSLSDVASVDGGVTWTAVLTPAADISDASNVVTLANTGLTDPAGNAGAGRTSSNNYAIDTLRPTSSIIVADTALRAGETSQVTITFSEAVSGFSNADLAIANGTLSDVHSADGGITWTAALTPSAGLVDASNAITLANSGVADLAGNAGAGSTASNNYAIDTQLPSSSIVVADNALKAGETSQVTITFSEAVTGFGKDDLAAANGWLSDVVSSDGGVTWTATLTPSADLADTSNAVTLANDAVTDLAGNAGTGTSISNNYAIDTLRPGATITVSDTALRIGETAQVTIAFSEAVSGFPSAGLSIGNGSLAGMVSADGGMTWTATLTPGDGVSSAANLVTLAAAGVADLAGNALAAAVSSNNYAIDTLRPTAAISLADNALRIGESTQITITFSEAVTGFGNADLAIENGSLSELASSDGGITWTAMLTPAANVSSAANAISLANAAVTDLAGNAGVGTTVSPTYAIDTIAPGAPAAPGLAAGSDSAAPGDNVTNAANPVFAGAGVEAFALVRLYAGTQVWSGVADAAGNWSITATGADAGLGIMFTADQVDAAQNVSARSAGVVVTIDRTAPAAFADSDAAANKLVVGAANGSGTGLTIRAADATGVTYSLADDAGGRFAIDSATGVVTLSDSARVAAQSYALVASATDGAGNVASQAFQIDAVNPNTAPSAADDSRSTGHDRSISIAVLANDSDPEGQAISINSFSQPSRGAVTQVGSNLVYTPDAGYVGADSFSYSIRDSLGAISNTASVTLNITNAAPVASNDSKTTLMNTAVSIGVLANDSDANGDAISIRTFGQPTHGSVVQSGSSLIYTPAANYTGTDSFVYTIKDSYGVSSGSATVTLTVNAPPNSAPSAKADSAATRHNQPVTIAVLSNDSDAEGQALSVNGFSQPAHGTVSLSGNSLVYTPTTNYVGSDSFSYTAKDSLGAVSGNATVTLSVTNAAPVAAGDSRTTSFNTAVSIAVLGNDSDPDGDAVAINDFGPAQHGTVSQSGSSLIYTPNANYSGSDSFAYTVRDSFGAVSGSATVAVTVNGAPNTAPIIDSFRTSGGFGHWHTQVTVHDNESRPGDLSYSIGPTTKTYPTGDNVGARADLAWIDYTYIVNATITDPQGASTVASAPVILDIAGSGFELLAPSASRATLDVNGDGIIDYSGWIGAGNGILVYDRNGNAAMDDVTEIDLSAYGPQGSTDLDGLRYAFDDNDDDVFDALDSGWTAFGVFQDLNQNGASDAGEFRTLDEIGITSIGLVRTGSPEAVNGNAVFGYAEFTWSDGRSGSVADVLFAFVSATSIGAQPVILQGTSAADDFAVAENFAGMVRVENFSSADGDRIVLPASLNELNFASAEDVLARSRTEGEDLVIDLGLGQTLTVVGVATLSVDDFVLNA